MSHGSCKNSKGRGFTLIELLVVISIISLLAAILFPVVVHAKSAGYRTGAISNAHQLGLAMTMYTIDNSDRYPFESVALTSDNDLVWTQTVGAYVNKITATGPSGMVIDDDLPKVFFDPGKQYKSQSQTHYFASNDYSGWGLSDDISNQQTPTHFGVPTAGGAPVFETQVANPSECLLLAETWDYRSTTLMEDRRDYPGQAEAMSALISFGYPDNGATVSLDTPYGGPGARRALNPYPGGFSGMNPALNITLFCDGHAKPMTFGSLTESGKYWSIGGNGQWP